MQPGPALLEFHPHIWCKHSIYYLCKYIYYLTFYVRILFPALLPFGRSAIALRFAPIFVLFSDLSKILLQQISTVLKQQIF